MDSSTVVCNASYPAASLPYFLVPKAGTVIKLPETGTTITYSTTTAESVAPNGTKVTLHGLDQWSEFHKSTTEMIITKAGR